MTNEELSQIVEDMDMWWERGVHETSDAKALGNLIALHLESIEHVEEDDSLEELPQEMMVRLMNVMFQGPTAEIREAARLFIQNYTESLGRLRENGHV